MPQRPDEDRGTYLTTSQAAKRAGVSNRTLYRYEADGKIAAAVRLPSGHRRFRPEDIDAMFKRAS
jgi:excisionase family DNA binding protein